MYFLSWPHTQLDLFIVSNHFLQ